MDDFLQFLFEGFVVMLMSVLAVIVGTMWLHILWRIARYFWGLS